jgi:hypothetical protein
VENEAIRALPLKLDNGREKRYDFDVCSCADDAPEVTTTIVVVATRASQTQSPTVTIAAGTTVRQDIETDIP